MLLKYCNKKEQTEIKVTARVDDNSHLNGHSDLNKNMAITSSLCVLSLLISHQKRVQN